MRPVARAVGTAASLATRRNAAVTAARSRSSQHARPLAARGSSVQPFSTSRRSEAWAPINIPKWLSENSHLLKPPINNFCVYNKEVTVMIVGGPNARTDYHINQTAEWFYQYKGTMVLKIIEDGQFRDVPIGEGEMFLLPPNVPHNPVRYADTVGIVLEQRRPSDSVDRLRWYCQNCQDVVHETSFHCTDLGTQIKAAVTAFKEDLHARTCKSCGMTCEVVPRVVEETPPRMHAHASS